MAKFLSLASLWLYSITPTLAEVTYPATIELDLIFPQNGTKASNVWVPAIWALQGGAAAIHHQFSVYWELYPPEVVDHYPEEGYISPSAIGNYMSIYHFENFRYANLAEDTYYVVDPDSFGGGAEPGIYNLTWSALVQTCEAGGGSLGSGSFLIELVDDKDFSADLDEYMAKCPVTVGRTTITGQEEFCGIEGPEPEGEPDPCRGRLRNKAQWECIREFYRNPDNSFTNQDYNGNNDTQACRDGFDILPIGWPEVQAETTKTITEDPTGTVTTPEETESVPSETGSGGSVTATDDQAPTPTDSSGSGDGGATPTPSGTGSEEGDSGSDETEPSGDGGGSLASTHRVGVVGLMGSLVLTWVMLRFA